MKFNLSQLFLFCISVFVFSNCSQKIPQIFKNQQKLHYSLAWKKVDNYPAKVGRTDDLFFFSPEKGYVINSLGDLYYTANGGETWENKFHLDFHSFFRCLTFKNEQVGWIGTLGMGDEYLRSNDPVIMYETNDGGESWTPTKINGSYPEGLCGLQTVSDNVIVGCGRVRGPSFFIKTIDGGKTWNSYDLNHLAGSLIAPYFYDENHGILIGGTTRDKIECKSLILETSDGGNTWDTIYVSPQKGEYLWKVSFPTKEIGFISIQRNVDDGHFYVLKTKDGGKSWQENEYIDEPYYVQGIGFINEKVGWMGGSNKWTMETRDGGNTWLRMADIGRGFNKFQFFGDSLAYGTGFGVFKMKGLRSLPNEKMEERYENGQLKSEISYQDGQKTGSARFYAEDKNLKSTGQFENNLKVKKWTYFNETQNSENQVKYKHGIAKISKKKLAEFAGIYQIEEGVFRTITYTKGQLHSQHSKSNRSFLIYPISDIEFVYENDWKTRVEFIRDEKGVVIQHVLKSGSRERAAKKVK